MLLLTILFDNIQRGNCGISLRLTPAVGVKFCIKHDYPSFGASLRFCQQLQVLCNVTLCRRVNGSRRFEELYCLHCEHQAVSWDCLTSNIEVLRVFESPGTVYTATQLSIPEEKILPK